MGSGCDKEDRGTYRSTVKHCTQFPRFYSLWIGYLSVTRSCVVVGTSKSTMFQSWFRDMVRLFPKQAQREHSKPKPPGNQTILPIHVCCGRCADLIPLSLAFVAQIVAAR